MDVEDRRGRRRFACELSDARFDPAKSLAAGWRYLDSLQRRFAGNLYLTYVGYNSGPLVAQRLFERVGRGGQFELHQLVPHLRRALEPHYGRAAARRAQALLKVHLPKLKRAFEDYRLQATAQVRLSQI